MKLLKLSVSILILATLLEGAACKSKQDRLIGLWDNVLLPETVQFKKDNTGQFVVKNMPTLRFTWQKMSDNTFQMNIDFEGGKKVLNGTLDNDTISLKNNGLTAVYTKNGY